MIQPSLAGSFCFSERFAELGRRQWRHNRTRGDALLLARNAPTGRRFLLRMHRGFQFAARGYRTEAETEPREVLRHEKLAYGMLQSIRR